MRSYQFCNFECSLQSTEPVSITDLEAMRREAACQVDQMVEAYKAGKHTGETPAQVGQSAAGDERIIDRSYSQEV